MNNCLRLLHTTLPLLPLLCIFCGELPLDPMLDPNNSSIDLFVTDKNDPVVYVDSTKQIALEMHLPQHFQTITVASECRNYDTVFAADAALQTDIIYFAPLFKERGQCMIVARATMRNGTLKDKADTLVLHIISGGTNPLKLGLSLVDAPSELIAGKADTLRFAVDNSDGKTHRTIQLYTETPLDPSVFTVLSSGPDSIGIAVSEAAMPGAAPADIGVITSDGTAMDTSWYAVAIVADTTAVQNTDGPQITPVAGTADKARVTKPAGMITFSITDTDGVDSVVWSLNNVVAGLVPVQEDGTYLLIYNLTTFGENFISVTARDASPLKKSNDFTLSFLYNTVPVAVANSIPAANASAVGTTTMFSWTGGADADGDSVYAQVLYGIDPAALTMRTPEVPTQIVTPDVPLSAGTTYFWQVIAYTKSPVADTVRSLITSFTTASDSTVTAVEITTPPAGPVAVFAGETITLSVAAKGDSPLSYQWYKGEMMLIGSTDAIFTKSNATRKDDGYYHVVVRNQAGAAVTSEPVSVQVKTKANLTMGPESQPVNEGADVTFIVSAVGDIPLKYQWLRDGEALFGKTDSVYVMANVTPEDNGAEVQCVVSNSFSSDTSKIAVVTVTAIPVHDVVFDTDGGSFVQPQNVKEGEPAQRPEENPTREGYEFIGWYLSKEASSEYDFSETVTQAITIYAKWVQVFTVTYNENYATTYDVPVDTHLYRYNEPATVRAKPAALRKDGHIFTGWCTDINGNAKIYQADDTILVTAGITFFAQWKKNQCAVIFDAQGGTVSPGTLMVDIGSPVAMPPMPQKTGYVVTGWFTSSDGTGTRASQTNVMGSMTFYANWVIVDGEGNTYTELVVGNQVWIMENIRTKKNFDYVVPKEGDPTADNEWPAWGQRTPPAYSWYSSETVGNATFGALYDYTAAQDTIITGWHLPSVEEWNTFISNCGGDVAAVNLLKDHMGGGVMGGVDGMHHWNYNEHGTYWTSVGSCLSITTSPNAIEYRSNGTGNAHSLRLIRDY